VFHKFHDYLSRIPGVPGLRGDPRGLEARGSGVDHSRTIYETQY
jgi:hypothetical protein